VRAVHVVPLGAVGLVASISWTCTPFTASTRIADAPDGSSGPDGTPDSGDKTYASTVLSDGPIAYYRFDEASGTVAHDASGHGNDALLGVGVTWGASGAIVGDSNTAIHVSEKSGGVSAGKHFDFNGTMPFTIEAWVKIEIVDSTYRFLFSKDYGPDTDRRQEYAVYVQQHDGLAFERYVDNARVAPFALAAPPTNPAKWTHVVGTYDGGNLAWFVDGKMAGRAPDARSQSTKPVDALIGNDNSGSTADGFGAMVGTIDEVALYDNALSADRVAAHFSAAGVH
jgi:hypothetical protein